MKQGALIAIGAVIVATAAAGSGYWIGQRNGDHASGSTATADTGKKERKLLYYRNPMGLPDTSPVPKKDPMGMDYIPVYEGEEEANAAGGSQLKISSEKIQKLGVRTERAGSRAIDQAVRAVGRVEADERRTYTISPKFEGYVERLYVNATGQEIAKGQALFDVYSPDLVSAQREYAIAMQGMQSLKGADSEAQGGMKQLAESSLRRLRNWDVSEEQLSALARNGESRRTLTFRSPVNGVVIEKKAVQGMRFMPGEMLYQVADLSMVWILADVFEQDIGLLKPKTKAKVSLNAYPGKTFEGTVTTIYPTLRPETRTVQVRLELPNPGRLLKPGMYADVQLAVESHNRAVTVPVSAVIDSGARRVVLVRAGEGRFEPREVRLGARGSEYVEILEGVNEGEDVVVAANFLLDAESNLKAALGAFTAAPAADAAKAGVSAGHHAEGTVEEVDSATGAVSISHGPVESLKWPAMTMEFKVANRALLANMKAGDAIGFEFVERQSGEWVITGFQPIPAKVGTTPAQPADPHAHHR